MIWTTRLKRHGGRQAIETARARQFERISQTFDKMAEHRQKALKDVFEWLNEHPLRVMSKADEDYFWPSEDSLEIVDLQTA